MNVIKLQFYLFLALSLASFFIGISDVKLNSNIYIVIGISGFLICAYSAFLAVNTNLVLDSTAIAEIISKIKRETLVKNSEVRTAFFRQIVSVCSFNDLYTVKIIDKRNEKVFPENLSFCFPCLKQEGDLKVVFNSILYLPPTMFQEEDFRMIVVEEREGRVFFELLENTGNPENWQVCIEVFAEGRSLFSASLDATVWEVPFDTMFIADHIKLSFV